MKRPTIGILAGMGPRSTSPFLELLLDECQSQYGAKHDIDYPHIIIYSLPTPFYIDKEVDEQLLKNSIKEGVEKLESCEVDLIGIPCNSAHSYFNLITENIKTPVIHMINETILQVESQTKVTLFATEMTFETGLYQEGLERKSCEFIYNHEWQNSINEIIIRVKTKNDNEMTLNIWNELINRVKESGVENIIIACTDLNVISENSNDGMKYIDSSKSLANSLIKEYINLNAK